MCVAVCFASVYVCCSVLQRVAACCNVLQFVAVFCSVLQDVARCCRVLQCCSRWCARVIHCVVNCTLPLALQKKVNFVSNFGPRVQTHEMTPGFYSAKRYASRGYASWDTKRIRFRFRVYGLWSQDQFWCRKTNNFSEGFPSILILKFDLRLTARLLKQK